MYGLNKKYRERYHRDVWLYQNIRQWTLLLLLLSTSELTLGTVSEKSSFLEGKIVSHITRNWFIIQIPKFVRCQRIGHLIRVQFLVFMWWNNFSQYGIQFYPLEMNFCPRLYQRILIFHGTTQMRYILVCQKRYCWKTLELNQNIGTQRFVCGCLMPLYHKPLS